MLGRYFFIVECDKIKIPMKDASPFVDEYVEFLNEFLHEDAKRCSVVFDCSNGATGPIIERLFPDSIIINGRPDGNFPNHAPDPLQADVMHMLQKKVVANYADVGIIFDADGDRMFVVDDRGRVVSSDAIAYLLLWSLRPKQFVSDSKAGWLIKKQPFAAKRIESKTGHYFIKQTMRSHAADFGHEASGHYYFKNFFYCDSGILAAIEVLNALVQLPYRLSDFVDLLPVTYVSAEINVPVSSDAHTALFARIKRTYEAKAKRVSRLDGITMEFSDPDWWFNVRLSNTEPLVRLHLEARDKGVYDVQLKKLTELIKQGK